LPLCFEKTQESEVKVKELLEDNCTPFCQIMECIT